MTDTTNSTSSSKSQDTAWRLPSLALIFAAWAVLQLGGLFSPGLLDDVDSVYIQIAREMLQRHDFVTPTIDGIRFFDKPPLMYWMAAGSMRVFGMHDWAARLPLALGVLALLLAVYALGIRLYRHASPITPDRAGLYAALAMATSIGPYLYTRFYIPDILIALWMTLSIHCFLIALERISNNSVILNEGAHLTSTSQTLQPQASALQPMLGFGAIVALSVLTKGLIGLIFPVGFVLLYLAFTRQVKLIGRLKVPEATASFLLLAAPWHILAALRNPAIAMPGGLGLPARAGWAWFYLYNEHVARFLGHRIPHDYGQVPIPLFWLLLALWLFPWAAFLPGALGNAIGQLRTKVKLAPETHTAALVNILWAGLILGFFTLSSRQEYYHLPALPALALMVGSFLARADVAATHKPYTNFDLARLALRWSLRLLVPTASILALVCGYFAITAPHPAPNTDLNALLSSNPAMYNLSLGHMFDLTAGAMGFFRGPLYAVAAGMLVLGPLAYFIRRRQRTFAANILIAAGMIVVLLAAHEGLVRFYPTLGSKDLALAINAAQQPGDIILIDGELTSGSTLLFYTDLPAGEHVGLVNGRVNGPWFGSFWPDAPHIFYTDADLDRVWQRSNRVFLLTYHPEARVPALSAIGPVFTLASSGGKTVLTNRR